MHEDIDRLTETFAAHEYLMPDPAQVLAKANLRARSYRRRRRAARATGASVLGAGIVAGSVTLPGLTWHQHGPTGLNTAAQPLPGITLPSPVASSTGTPIASATPSPSASTVATPIASPTSTPTPTASTATTYNEQQELDAYFGAGYDYNNATALSSLWHETDIAKVKADAGLKLLQGVALPVTPNGTPETPAQKDQDAFFAAGYDYNDAMTLGTLWHETDLTQIKTDAGQKLLAGQTLPIAPSGDAASSGTPVPAASDAVLAQERAAFFAAGYDYDNAVTLGQLWHDADIFQVKADAGQKLLAGESLPALASASPSPTAS